MKFRKCYVLREVEIPMESLKPGDVFRLEAASEEDKKHLDETQWQIALSNGTECEPAGNAWVRCDPVTLPQNGRFSR